MQVSTTNGAAIPYMRKVKLVPLPDPQLMSPWQGINFLLNFPSDPNQVSQELAEQLLGLRPRPPLPHLRYLPPKPRQVLGEEWLDLEAWWRQVLFLQGRLTPLPPKSGPVEP